MGDLSNSKNLLIAPHAVDRDEDAWKLYVFRKSRDLLSTRSLLQQLRAEIDCLDAGSGSVIDALVLAGEIETGLSDAGSTAAIDAAHVVDHLARMVCGDTLEHSLLLRSLQRVEAANFPARVLGAHPEGFSYYGLNPLDFADLARRISCDMPARVNVVGIRSAGTVLGAVVAAQLRSCGKSVDRITVRPAGEPYHRETTFDAAQLEWIGHGFDQRAAFLVVDEGPGFSGSTFLSVAKALADASVPTASILLMGSRPFSQSSGIRNGEARSRFRCYSVDYATHIPADAGRSLGDGAWRELLYETRSLWPARWVEQEQVKHLSRDGQLLFKFEGFGRYGRLSRQQALALAAAGFSPRLLGFDNGFAGYEFVRGRPLTQADLTQNLLSQIAEYCAFRVYSFPAASPNSAMLRDMLQINLGIEFGLEPVPVDLPMERPVYPDCRMFPHEWLGAHRDGRLLKADAVGQGEGHQLPGPTDIGWDLAGTIVEWRLSPEQASFLLQEYQNRSGDRAVARVQEYLVAYLVFRMAHCRMGAASMGHRREAKYLHRLYLEYAQKVKVKLEARAR